MMLSLCHGGIYWRAKAPPFDGLFLGELEKCAGLAIWRHLDLLCSLGRNKGREQRGKMGFGGCIKSIGCCFFFHPNFHLTSAHTLKPFCDILPDG